MLPVTMEYSLLHVMLEAVVFVVAVPAILRPAAIPNEVLNLGVQRLSLPLISPGTTGV